MTSLPNIRISHLGICVENMDVMRAFYVEVLGFTETDRGETLGMEIVFLSRSPRAHHQIVLATGRPPGLGRNRIAPMFGPVINQISFELDSLAELRRAFAYLQEKAVNNIMPANHGSAWSLYFEDPEGNKIEFFVDSDWYCAQPVLEPLDFTLDDDAIRDATQALCRAGRDYMTAAAWREEMEKRMGTTG